MKRFILVLVLVITSLIPFSFSTVLAQGGGCPSDMSEGWAEDAAEIALDYEDALETRNDLKRAGELQELRRDLDELDRETEGDVEVYLMLQGAINLATDSAVAAEMGDDDDAEDLMEDADEKYQQAVACLAGGDGNGRVDAEITKPEDGDELEGAELIIRGEYDPETLPEGSDLWVVIVPPNLMYYPQVFQGCDASTRTPVTYTPPDKWAVTAFLGTETEGIGDEYELTLMVGDADATAAIYAKFDEWCADETWPGLTGDEFYEMGLVAIGDPIYVERVE